MTVQSSLQAGYLLPLPGSLNLPERSVISPVQRMDNERPRPHRWVVSISDFYESGDCRSYTRDPGTGTVKIVTTAGFQQKGTIVDIMA